MTGGEQSGRNAFDFSSDVPEFRARLWRMIRNRTAPLPVQELEDEELLWVNAAGMPARPPEDEERLR